jgi:hypothetical protein
LRVADIKHGTAPGIPADLREEYWRLSYVSDLTISAVIRRGFEPPTR